MQPISYEDAFRLLLDAGNTIEIMDCLPREEHLRAAVAEAIARTMAKVTSYPTEQAFSVKNIITNIALLAAIETEKLIKQSKGV